MNSVEVHDGPIPGCESRANLKAVRTRVLREVVGGFGAISALLIGAGMLFTHVLERSALLAWDGRVVRNLSMDRTTELIRWSSRWSLLADAPSIVAVAAAVALICAVRRRWIYIVWIAVALALELGIFLTVSYSVGRRRPDVAHLGSVPSTGSFPSGHIAATITLYATIAFLIRLTTPNRWARAVAWAWTAFAAVMVGWARVYRGMHHPLDVVAGALLGTAVCLVGWRAFGRAHTPNPSPNATTLSTTTRISRRSHDEKFRCTAARSGHR